MSSTQSPAALYQQLSDGFPNPRANVSPYHLSPFPDLGTNDNQSTIPKPYCQPWLNDKALKSLSWGDASGENAIVKLTNRHRQLPLVVVIGKQQSLTHAMSYCFGWSSPILNSGLRKFAPSG